jgi:hypothetical protein
MSQFRLTAITPKHLPSTAEYMKALENSVDQTGNLILRDLQSTVRTWKTKVSFYVVIHKSGGEYAVIAGTNNLIYLFVDHGTKAHPIKPKRSKYLAFQSGYRAKTRPNIIGSQDGGAFGDTIFSKGVKHPGTKRRNFILRIAKRRQVTMRQIGQQAIAKVNRKQS